MPIRINLLAEAQAAEELRRKDPVKRALLAGVMLVLTVLCWSSTLQFKIISSKSDLRRLEANWQAIEKNYQEAVESQRRSQEATEKLSSLQQYTTNRFLWGTALNAFQQSLVGVDDVQVVRLKTDQSYVVSEEVKPVSAAGKVTPGKPASSTEKLGLTIEAIDSSTPPGGQVSRFKEALATVPYFQSSLQKTNGVLLTSLSAPQLGTAARSSYVMFTLQCYFPEKIR
jgi:hypothetical protein